MHMRGQRPCGLHFLPSPGLSTLAGDSVDLASYLASTLENISSPLCSKNDSSPLLPSATVLFYFSVCSKLRKGV